MDKEFITISEAARLTGQSDVAIMRAIKDYLQQPGVTPEEILKKEPRGNGFLYLVNKEVLLRELEKTKDAPQGETSSKEERVQEAQKPEQSILSAKEEMIATLQKILDVKDRQIEDLSSKIDQLIERSRETNILLKTMQDKLFLLDGSKKQAQQNSAK